MKFKRTNNCGDLSKKDIGKEVVLMGWVQSSRDHGGIIFIDIRDKYGLTQVVFDPENNKNIHPDAEKLRREDVFAAKGKVRARGEGLSNPNLKTGEIEVIVDDLEILSKADTPPIEVEDRVEANEELRLKYRFLDLRRPKMQKHLLIRHNAAKAARNYLNSNGFLEIETPMLVRATPEGARDYVVPSRVNPGKWYALPQSPQLYKQILMVSGCDRYYQLARCLRDEDLRADRQPEHTQIDLEMSFVVQEDVLEMVEGLYKQIMKEVLGNDIKEQFIRMTYDDSMKKYGTDKPDLRFGLELLDVTEVARESDFEVFKKVEEVKCINPSKDFSRKDLDKYITYCQQNGAKGMAWMRVTDKGLESNIVKFFSEDVQKKLLEVTKAKPGSTLMFIADSKKKVASVLDKLRLKLRDDLGLVKKDDFKFVWITDFPLFEYNDEENKWDACHHIFTAPKKEHIKFLDSDPAKVYADLYDLVLNGLELGSGSIRETNAETQKKVMEVIGITEDEAREKFGFLMDAFKYGVPPHGGMGLGFDRIVAMMCGFNDIREVIAFPKNKNAECPMDGSPGSITDKQMKELNVKSDIVKKK